MGEATAGGVRAEGRDADQPTEIFRRPDLDPAGASTRSPANAAEPHPTAGSGHAPDHGWLREPSEPVGVAEPEGWPEAVGAAEPAGWPEQVGTAGSEAWPETVGVAAPEGLPDEAEPALPIESVHVLEPGRSPEPVPLPWLAVPRPLPPAPTAPDRASADPDAKPHSAFDIDLPLEGDPVPDLTLDARPAEATGDDEEQPSWNRPSGVSPITRAERRAAEAAAAARATGVEQTASAVGQALWALTRVAFGVAFLWTFIDRLFGLGAPTPAAASWRAGTSPTSGFLAGVDGPFADLFGKLSGQAWADWAFMISLAVIGLGLILGVGVAVAATLGTVLLVLTWVAALPPAGNPFLDGRLLGALVIIGIAGSGAGLRYSLAPWWRRTALVKKLSVLR